MEQYCPWLAKELLKASHGLENEYIPYELRKEHKGKPRQKTQRKTTPENIRRSTQDPKVGQESKSFQLRVSDLEISKIWK